MNYSDSSARGCASPRDSCDAEPDNTSTYIAVRPSDRSMMKGCSGYAIPIRLCESVLSTTRKTRDCRDITSERLVRCANPCSLPEEPVATASCISGRLHRNFVNRLVCAKQHPGSQVEQARDDEQRPNSRPE